MIDISHHGRTIEVHENELISFLIDSKGYSEQDINEALENNTLEDLVDESDMADLDQWCNS